MSAIKSRLSVEELHSVAAHVSPSIPTACRADLIIVPDIVTVVPDGEKLERAVFIVRHHQVFVFARPTQVTPCMPAAVRFILPHMPNIVVAPHSAQFEPAILLDTHNKTRLDSDRAR